MATINLLPWRDEQRQEKKKEFFTVLVGFCILGALCSFVWVSSVQGSIDNQNTRNTRLQQEIKALDEKVKEIQQLKKMKADLIARMLVIQQLEGTRPVIVHYLDDFARAIPDGVFLTSLDRTGENFSISGIAPSTARVADLMRNLDNSDWFKDTQFISSRPNERFGEGMQEFSLRSSGDKPKTNANEQGGS